MIRVYSIILVNTLIHILSLEKERKNEEDMCQGGSVSCLKHSKRWALLSQG